MVVDCAGVVVEVAKLPVLDEEDDIVVVRSVVGREVLV